MQCAVLFFFSIELIMRFIAHGTVRTLRKPWNAFDAFVLTLSILLVMYKILLDYVVLHAPHPPVLRKSFGLRPAIP